LVASYGIAGMEPSGDERGGVVVPGSGRGAAGSDMSLSFRSWRAPYRPWP